MRTVFQVEFRVAPSGQGNCLSNVSTEPDFGPSLDGWRRQLSKEGNALAGLGLGASAARGSGSFYLWLLSQARALSPDVLTA